MQVNQAAVRVAVAALTMSAAGFATWVASEGTGPTTVRADGQVMHRPYVPTAGDVPTIGHGSTRYEDGTPVRLSDPPITRQRAEQLATCTARTKPASRPACPACGSTRASSTFTRTSWDSSA